MPRAARMKHLCAFAEADAPKVKKPRAKPAKLTPEEKEEKALAAARAGGREKKKVWEATLKPWASASDYRGLISGQRSAQFKSDAKKAFGLSDKEIASLPFMGFSRSSKTIYRIADCKALADRKRVALGEDAFNYPVRAVMERTNDSTQAKSLLAMVTGAGLSSVMR